MKNFEGVESLYNISKTDKDKDFLNGFSQEEQFEIRKKQDLLSVLGRFIGKDFNIPVELNEPGKGWCWNFKENIIKIDPKDLLNKPIDYLRFVISHEGGHRRITRADFIPIETWNQPGFSFLLNSLEDPRDNNFVAESYPRFKDQMTLAYQSDLDFETEVKNKAKDKLGYEPSFMQAGFEYIKQWFKEVGNGKTELSSDLSEEVKKTVLKTINDAKKYWWLYPSKEEADQSEVLITKYAEKSYNIALNKIWPEFQKLVEADRADAKMQEFLKDMQSDKSELESKNKLKNKLNTIEQKELESALDKATGDQKGQETKSDNNIDLKTDGQPINLDSLSEGLKKKIKDFINDLPKDKQKELESKATQSIEELNDELNQKLKGKLVLDPNDLAKEKENDKNREKLFGNYLSDKDNKTPLNKIDESKLSDFRDQIEKSLNFDANIYEQERRKVLPIIDKLENDLREIFIRRQTNKWESGFKYGKKLDIKRRMQEKAKNVSVIESRAWQKRELPQTKDYAISILVDLSGSMEGQKIKETFKGVIVLAEVLNRLSIKTEVLGFNDRIYEYQNFNQAMSMEIRDNMGGMLKEVCSDRARYNDDGWALKSTSERLAHQKEQEKFILVLSDGLPEESPQHGNEKFSLGRVITEITEQTDQKLIGLGIGSDTDHVSNYYPNSLANIDVSELGDKLADVIRDVIDNFDKF